MKYLIISTGSNGNAAVINDCILIDCGVPFKSLKEVIGKLKLVLLTHIHADHFKRTTIKRLAASRPTLRFACGSFLVPALVECGVSKSKIDVLDFGKKYNYSFFKVAPVKLYHDVDNFGYRIYFNDEKAIYATDTEHLNGIKAKGYDLYMLEANYEDEEIKNRIAERKKAGEYVYEDRVLRTHLSKQQADDFFFENMISGKSELVYLHQHKECEKNDGNCQSAWV
ncbi:MAG: MBL fold metallo-hydrolase [Monoglobaceae bacterium]